MSEHHQFIFPRYPHLPAPDWPALHAQLLKQGFILPVTGATAPRAALADFNFEISLVPGRHFKYDENMRTPADVLKLYVDTGELPADLPLNPALNLEETRALLKERNIALHEFDTGTTDIWHSPEHCFGAAAVDRFSPEVRAAFKKDPRDAGIQFTVYDGLFIAIGENLCEPMLPGTNEVLEELPPFGTHLDFITAACDDPAVQWINPETGRAYYLFDLDWQYSLGLGTHMIMTYSLDRESVEALAALIEQQTGCAMACSHRHL